MEYANSLLIQTGFHILLGLSVYTVALVSKRSMRLVVTTMHLEV